ncbi:MAG: transporter, family, multidrug resistance protein [Rhodospirillaceae bacterium]|nr:transporter, family, multidrug resistance protein [Rhodospirillaceae bacterium]
MSSSYAKNAIVLGLLAAVGPFAIDMYLPALPMIAADLHASTAATQMTLTVFFMALGICQIVYGPVSDMVGRKPPLYFGLALFTIGSIGCGLAPSIEWLIFFRFVQGIGASSVMVIPRAIIRDLHTGIEATRLMSLVILVFSVSPILAPLTGSALIVPFGWRAVFVAVTVVAVLGFLLVAVCLPETRAREDRIRLSVANLLGGFGQLLRDGRFLGLTFIGGLGMSSFFAFLASSSFIYIDHFGLTPTEYSVTFAVNAVGFIGSSQFAAKLGTRFGMAGVVRAAVSLYALFASILFAVTALGVDSLAVLIALLFAAFACLGLVVPSTMVLSLEEHGPIAGMASALGGTLQMVTGGIMIVIVSLFFDGTAFPMVTTIALCALGALALSLATLRRRELAAQPAE